MLRSLTLTRKEQVINELETIEKEFSNIKSTSSRIVYKNASHVINELQKHIGEITELTENLKEISEEDISLLDDRHSSRYKLLNIDLAKTIKDFSEEVNTFEEIISENKNTGLNTNSFLGCKDTTQVIFSYLSKNQQRKAANVCSTWLLLINKPIFTSSELKILVENDLLSIRAALILERNAFDRNYLVAKDDLIGHPSKVNNLLIKEKLPTSLFMFSGSGPYGGVNIIHQYRDNIKSFISLYPEAPNIIKELHPAVGETILLNSDILLQELKSNNLHLRDFLNNDSALNSFHNAYTHHNYSSVKKTDWIEKLLAKSSSNKLKPLVSYKIKS